MNREEVAKILPVKPAFFLNEHHRVTFRGLYPRTTHEVDRPPAQAFTAERRSQWLPELSRMIGQTPWQAKMTVFYIAGCTAKRG